jgi:hypothetical protein
MEAYHAISAVSKLWLPISTLGMVSLCLAHSTAGYPSATALFTSSIPLYKDIFMSSDNIFASSTPITQLFTSTGQLFFRIHQLENNGLSEMRKMDRTFQLALVCDILISAARR